ncbi:uncharacterized protein LOC105701655 isoform X3 [Orussus abietinus]|uniref:uncharacterized protein LOC105701655 isoform X3 n=1 Tax=Orussus abietinus TaxID=222816 RepID=UPI0006254C4F|nr:uncharacterized protein LOC105701655 isoform X3 [Orussus abietinus]
MATFNEKHWSCWETCISGLSREDIDQVTDHIHQTLSHHKGKKIFRTYLKQCQRVDDLACLDLYDICNDFIVKEESYRCSSEEPTLDNLTKDVQAAMDMAEALDDIPEIDLAILERFQAAVTSSSRDDKLRVLEDTKVRLMDHLRNAHDSFKVLILQHYSKKK